MNIIKHGYNTLLKSSTWIDGKMTVNDAANFLERDGFPSAKEIAKLIFWTVNPTKKINMSRSCITSNIDNYAFDCYELSNDEVLKTLKALSRAAKEDPVIMSTISELANSDICRDQIISKANDIMPDHFWDTLSHFNVGKYIGTTFIFFGFVSATPGTLSFLFLHAVLAAGVMNFNTSSIAVFEPEDPQVKSDMCEGCTEDHCVMDDKPMLNLSEQLEILMTTWRQEFDLFCAIAEDKRRVKFKTFRRVFKDKYGKGAWKPHFYGMFEIMARGPLGVVTEINGKLHFEFSDGINASIAREMWHDDNEDEDYSDRVSGEIDWEEEDDEDDDFGGFNEEEEPTKSKVGSSNKPRKASDDTWQKMSRVTNTKISKLFREFYVATTELILQDIDGMSFSKIVDYAKNIHEVTLSAEFINRNPSLKDCATKIFNGRFSD